MRRTRAYNFGLSQEDERTEQAALALSPGDRVLCIASAGEMPLSLLALGAGEVVAVDVDAGQLHLTALKLAAIRGLDRETALAFLGYLPASRAERRAQFSALTEFLCDEARNFWRDHEHVATGGAIWQGRYERYIRKLVFLARPLLHRRTIEGLFETSSPEEQRAYFDREIARPAVRGLFRVAFNPRVFAGRGMDPRSLHFRKSEVPLGEQYFRQFRAFCTECPARDNHLLQLTLLGRLVNTRATPACFSPEGIATLRARHGSVRLSQEDVRTHLASTAPATYEKVHLSNLADWLSEDQFDALLRTLAARIVRPGRAVWRFLHVARGVPPDLRDLVRVDAELGARLAARDRFPFYGIVPVCIGVTPS